MEMSGEERIPASQADTWAALNDPETLKACVPGCESIERVADDEFRVLMVARIGPVSAKFKGTLSLSDLNPPASYSIAFEGQGGAAGFGKGAAQVQLAPEGDETLLRYQVKASVGGKLAQIGSRLVDAAAKKISQDFFAAFRDKVGAQHGTDGAHDAGHDEHHPAPVERDPDLPTVSNASLAFLAAGALVVLVAALYAMLH